MMAASIDARQFSNQRLYRRAPGVYRPLRNTVLGTWLIAIPIYATVPVAPPRLAHAGIVDAVSEQAGFALTGRSTLFFNPLAAVPSLHVGFAFRHRRWPDRHRDRLPHHAADSSCRSRLHRASIDRPTMTFSSACHHLVAQVVVAARRRPDHRRRRRPTRRGGRGLRRRQRRQRDARLSPSRIPPPIATRTRIRRTARRRPPHTTWPGSMTYASLR